MPILWLQLMAAMAASTARASIPSYADAVADCAVTSTHSGTCTPMPATSVCARYFAPGEPIYLPTGMTTDDLEHGAISRIGSAIINKGFFTSECFNFTISNVCNSRYFRCLPSGNDSEPLPQLVCAQYCADLWTVRAVPLAGGR